MKVCITGGTGMVGRHLVARLSQDSAIELHVPTRQVLNLLDREKVLTYFREHQFDLVVHLAAKVGGIQANIDEPVAFLVDNTYVNMHVIEGALRADIPQLINLSSACMYPRGRELLHETDLLTGQLEPTNEPYALAKVTSGLLCTYIKKQYGLQYKSLIPSNLYGPYDNFHPTKSHLIPAVLRKLHEAKENNQSTVTIWGDGEARREFMYVDDLIDALCFTMNNLAEMPAMANVGLGKDYSINEYYQIAAEVVGYQGGFEHDLEKPAGMQRKLLDSTRLKAMGWSAKISVRDGLKKTYQYYLENELSHKL